MSITDTIGLWNDIAQFVVAGVAIVAVIVALITSNRQIRESRDQQKEQIKASSEQLNKQIEESRRLAAEERQHQSRPILVPKGDLSRNVAGGNARIRQELMLQNMGSGIAFNIHSCLYAYIDNPSSVTGYGSWNDGPVAPDSSLPIVLSAQDAPGLAYQTKVDGTHWLHNDEDPQYRVGRLTITYHDLFGIRHVSVFDYLSPSPKECRWMHVATKSGITQDLEDLDYARVANSRRAKPSK